MLCSNSLATKRKSSILKALSVRDRLQNEKERKIWNKMSYRRIHHVKKLLAFHGNQLEYNGSQGANGAG